MSISVGESGSFDSVEAWLKKVVEGRIFDSLSKYGAAGVAALSGATPADEGVTGASWFYEILQEKGRWSIVWGNSNVVDGRQIAVLIQYGHGTGTGGYVAPNDYINPVMRPIFDQMAAEGWKAVIS